MTALVADAIQIQQALIKPVVNAMDAVADLPEERRTIVVMIKNVAGFSVAAIRAVTVVVVVTPAMLVHGPLLPRPIWTRFGLPGSRPIRS